jgi:hypothetical protein
MKISVAFKIVVTRTYIQANIQLKLQEAKRKSLVL